MSTPDTEIGGGGRGFPSTSWTALDDLRSSRPDVRRRKLEELIAQYWKPIYCVIRSGWAKSNEDAKDLTQEFFVRSVLEGRLVEGFDPERGSFRRFLKGALSNFMMNRARDASTQKRGGHLDFVQLDGPDVDLSEYIQDARALAPDQLFDAAWKSQVLGLAVRRLEERLLAEGKEVCFRIFRRYDLEGGPEAPSYEALAKEFGLTPHVVKHSLGAAREGYRAAVTDILLGYAGTPEILALELKDLFGPIR